MPFLARRCSRRVSVVLDFGARAHGYCSDMTRTVFLGQPSQKMRDAYAASAARTSRWSRAAGRDGQGHARAGERARDAGFADKMATASHGVGIDIHEQPALSPRNEQPSCRATW
ncbi:MAG: M24 family metallopeptidase [Eggerthella lenta]